METKFCPALDSSHKVMRVTKRYVKVSQASEEVLSQVCPKLGVMSETSTQTAEEEQAQAKSAAKIQALQRGRLARKVVNPSELFVCE